MLFYVRRWREKNSFSNRAEVIERDKSPMSINASVQLLKGKACLSLSYWNKFIVPLIFSAAFSQGSRDGDKRTKERIRRRGIPHDQQIIHAPTAHIPLSNRVYAPPTYICVRRSISQQASPPFPVFPVAAAHMFFEN